MVDETGKKERFSRVSQGDGRDLIVRGDYLGTLKCCQGHYECPVLADGTLGGPLVGYSGDYPDEVSGVMKKYVGFEYFNFSRADQWPAVLKFFANRQVALLDDRRLCPTVVLGVPMAGLKYSQVVAEVLECRHIFAEKKLIRVGENNQRSEEKIVLSRYEIEPGDTVLIGEELVNNFKATGQLVKLVEASGGTVVGITAAINRSFPFRSEFTLGEGYNPIPVISVIDRETPQYRQDDPLVAAAIQADNIIWEPKSQHWPRLQKVMEAHGLL